MSTAETAIAAVQSLLIALSTLFALLAGWDQKRRAGWTKWSKILGTFAAIDGGRVVRYGKLFLQLRAILAAGLVALLAFGCAGALPAVKTPPIDAQRVQSLAVSVLVVTDRALSAVILTDRDFEAYAPAVAKLRSAHDVLDTSGATIDQACDALRIVGPVASQISCFECSKLAEAALAVTCTGGVL